METVKHDIIIRNWKENLLYQLPNNLGPRILENEGILSMFTLVFVN